MIFFLYSVCLLHCLVSEILMACSECALLKCSDRANQKGPVLLLDSFMIRVLATSGSEVEAFAVIRAVQALASALRINRVLTHLRLHGNDVGVQGAQAHEIASNTSQWQDGQV